MTFYIGRFSGLETMEFDSEIITPMFLGGSDTKKAEFRIPSIKGALRFWWRALYGSDDLNDMKKRESQIFGSTDEKSCFSISLKEIENIKPVLKNLPQGFKVQAQSRGKTFPISIVEYLAFGLCEYNKPQRKNVYTKEHLPEGSKIKILLHIKNAAFKDQILESLGLLVNFGGLGARSRNGFGSININGLPLTNNLEGVPKSFSSLSKKSIIFNKFKVRDKWEDALSEIGNAYREARTSLEPRHVFEKRPLIAKPLIARGEININERHSKPYFLHVNKMKDGKYKGHILFMPYNYHDPRKREEYFKTCEEMNQKLFQLSGGPK